MWGIKYGINLIKFGTWRAQLLSVRVQIHVYTAHIKSIQLPGSLDGYLLTEYNLFMHCVWDSNI